MSTSRQVPRHGSSELRTKSWNHPWGSELNQISLWTTAYEAPLVLQDFPISHVLLPDAESDNFLLFLCVSIMVLRFLNCCRIIYNGCWINAWWLDAWCMLDCSRLVAHGQGPRAFLSHEPWAMKHEPSSTHQASSINKWRPRLWEVIQKFGSQASFLIRKFGRLPGGEEDERGAAVLS